eukprot:6605729-Prymnesium_polylepis.1
MLHGRASGEVASVTIAEFALAGRRVITPRVPAKSPVMHVEELGERGIYYHDYASLVAVLTTFDRSAPLSDGWVGYRRYAPATVMARFGEYFNVAPLDRGAGGGCAAAGAGCA